MVTYIFATFVGFVLFGIGYQAFIAPKRWMKQYGDGNYSPLRRVYKNASPKSEAGFTRTGLLTAIVGICFVFIALITVIIWAIVSALS